MNKLQAWNTRENKWCKQNIFFQRETGVCWREVRLFVLSFSCYKYMFSLWIIWYSCIFGGLDFLFFQIKRIWNLLLILIVDRTHTLWHHETYLKKIPRYLLWGEILIRIDTTIMLVDKKFVQKLNFVMLFWRGITIHDICRKKEET